MGKNMKLELCAASIEAIKIAKELNFNRIELCQSLEQGGLTPSIGMIEFALKQKLETHVLIRPRPGGFVYNSDEIEIINTNINLCKELGVNGIVIGVLDQKKQINEEIVDLILRNSKDMEVTFHRAFDDTPCFRRSLDILINIGVTRVLSSGLELNVDSGFNNLKEMVEYANGKIEIMAGGGINPGNISKIIDEVRPDAIHFSGTEWVEIDNNSLYRQKVLKISREKLLKIHSRFL